MNKKLLTLLIVFGSVSLVAGAWLFTITGGFTAVVESIPGHAKLDLDIPSLSVNTTQGADVASAGTSFLLNKDMILSVAIIETIQDNSAGECLDYETDCIMNYTLENNGMKVPIKDKDTINITAQAFPRALNATLSCEAYSCPQSRSAEITFTQIQ